jgi:hypothetical protein
MRTQIRWGAGVNGNKQRENGKNKNTFKYLVFLKKVNLLNFCVKTLALNQDRDLDSRNPDPNSANACNILVTIFRRNAFR